MLDWLVLLIMFLPLATGFLLGLNILLGYKQGEPGEPFTSTLTFINAAIVFLSLSGVLTFSLFNKCPGYHEVFQWFTSADLKINLAVLLDPLGLIAATVFSLLLMLTIRFSDTYLHREAGFQRFFMLLNFFLGAILFITLSGNALTAFVGWEIAGLCSYLLIGYAYERPVATAQASRVFITNRLGDAGFILSLVLAYIWVGDTNWISFSEKLQSLSHIQSSLIMSGFVLAALVKSAQVPFTPWITRALEGPTPSSAIFYGALLVHAGVFLLLRLQGAVDAVAAAQFVILILSGLTMLYGWIGGMAQTDIKTALIFSTIAQVAVMFIFIALGWFTLTLILMIAHALWRCYQMLSAPSYNHLTSRPARPAPQWLQKSKVLLTAALQHFWLDHITEWLVVKPVQSLSYEFRQFDRHIVNRIVGLPAQVQAVTSLAESAQRKKEYVSSDETLPRAPGILGAFMDGIANILHWFEEQLVLKGSGEGLVNLLMAVGRYLRSIDELLSQPRYLWLIILITLIFLM